MSTDSDLNDDTIELAARYGHDHGGLAALARSSHATVRAAVAANMNAPRVIIDTLCQDRDPAIAATACMNPHASERGHMLALHTHVPSHIDEARDPSVARMVIRSICAHPHVGNNVLSMCAMRVHRRSDIGDFIAARMASRRTDLPTHFVPS